MLNIFPDSHDHRNVGIILKLLNINAVAQHLQSSNDITSDDKTSPKYKGPLIAVTDDPLLRDVKLPVKNDRSKLVSLISIKGHSMTSHKYDNVLTASHIHTLSHLIPVICPYKNNGNSDLK